MDQKAKLEVFKAQTSNKRMMEKAKTQVSRSINYALRREDKLSIQVQTKLYVLVFCAWVEANFSKVIHTPYGFSLDEIRQIKEAYKSNSLKDGWNKCIELGLKRVTNNPKSNYIPNIKQRLKDIVSEYVVSPSLIRNKIAHGQWDIALNRDNTALNPELTNKLSQLDVVTVNRWFIAHEFLAQIVESLIESPERVFNRDYWVLIEELEISLEKSKDWSLNSKKQRLKLKPTNPNSLLQNK